MAFYKAVKRFAGQCDTRFGEKKKQQNSFARAFFEQFAVDSGTRGSVASPAPHAAVGVWQPEQLLGAQEPAGAAGWLQCRHPGGRAPSTSVR